MSLHSEISEQPRRIESLLFSARKSVDQVASAIRQRNIQYVFLAAAAPPIMPVVMPIISLARVMVFHWRSPRRPSSHTIIVRQN